MCRYQLVSLTIASSGQSDVERGPFGYDSSDFSTSELNGTHHKVNRGCGRNNRYTRELRMFSDEARWTWCHLILKFVKSSTKFVLQWNRCSSYNMSSWFLELAAFLTIGASATLLQITVTSADKNRQSPCSMLVFKVKLQHRNDDNILKYHAIQRCSNTTSSGALNRLKTTCDVNPWHFYR